MSNFAGYPLLDSRFATEHRARFRRDTIPELALANSFYCPSGRWPARGWLLLRRADYDQINPYATNLQLTILDTIHPPLIFKNLTVVQARCVSRGVAADPNAIYLVEVTDARGIVWNEWAEWPTTSMYNVRSPAYPGGYYSASLSAGIPWTWTQMFGDLWGQMSAVLGAYPGIPITPLGTPENYQFPGTSCWLALNRLLDLFALTVTVDLTSATPYSIVQVGSADANTALQAQFAGLLEDDLEYIDGGSGRVPGQVTVLFHRRNQFYGTEETIRNDSLQWASTPLYSITVTATAGGFPQFASAAGTHCLWDDFTVRYDVDGNPLAADVATANLIALATVQDYYNQSFRGMQGFLWQLYAGALPFTAGSSIDGVCWRQRPEEDESGKPRMPPNSLREQLQRVGWRTELVRGPQPPWPQVKFQDTEEV